ncbi:cytochrome c family protein [Novosphingobium sp.]|uniref:c-type cytochrome n=1 Tax=Novosphingobium sp. TaxID=1874826 RepID=UPI00273295E1|nr:c-type cytochrome [Novosphingobium sp.]MDP3908561.1 c-type cytochrome [Novosphingobium sp.]
MHRSATLAVIALALTLTACGSKVEDPVEQIVVRPPGVAAVPAAPAAWDLVAAGKAAFAVCTACHSAEPGGASGIGPNLHGVVGRGAGSVAGFSYSEAMAKSGLTWTESELDAFIANPSGKVPGTEMVAGQVADAQRRAAIIAYLASLKN